MAIPNEQCRTWANPGAGATLQASHEAVRRALSANGSPLRGRDYEVYLQGSYKNDTNVRGDSDVDVVVELRTTVHHDSSGLPLADGLRFISRNDATYRWEDFDRDVRTALVNAFGAPRVNPQNKCITVRGGSGTLDADVVVAITAVHYTRFVSNLDNDSEYGIAFWTRTDGLNRRIVNFPRQHYANGAAKNGGNAWFKPTVRMFKNARNYMIDRGLLAHDVVPSYFLECLLFNVPDDRFGTSYAATYSNAVRWLIESELNPFLFTCQNAIIPLFGNTPEQWQPDHAAHFIDRLATLWNQWS